MAKKQGSFIGSWAFLVGVLLAVILGAIGQIGPAMTITLFVIGLIVGLLNVADKETNAFLISGVVLIIASAFGGAAVSVVGWLEGIFNALLLIFVPATVIVAIKNVFSIAHS